MRIHRKGGKNMTNNLKKYLVYRKEAMNDMFLMYKNGILTFNYVDNELDNEFNSVKSVLFYEHYFTNKIDEKCMNHNIDMIYNFVHELRRKLYAHEFHYNLKDK